MSKIHTTIAIQAGGQSRRMGQEKGLMILGEKRLIEHALDRVSALGEEIILTTNHPDGYRYLGLPMIPDEQPGSGALPGLKTALQGSRGEIVLVVACDMPFLNTELLKHQISLAAEADVIVPQWDDRYQTMHAIYRRETCLTAVENAIKAGEKRMISFYGNVRVIEIEKEQVAQFDPDGLSFFNVNTPEDLARAELWIKGARSPLTNLRENK